MRQGGGVSSGRSFAMTGGGSHGNSGNKHRSGTVGGSHGPSLGDHNAQIKMMRPTVAGDSNILMTSQAAASHNNHQNSSS